MSLLAAALLAAAPPSSGACAPEPPLAYVCGAEKPEDVLALPGTPWLVASGFAPGSGLKLVDARTRTLARWYVGGAQLRWDRDAWPDCPGPPEVATFDAHGLALRRAASGWRLLVVSHGGREAIEVFDVALVDGTPTLAWRGCAPLPPGQVANSVAAFGDGTILATVLTRPGTTIADFVEGRATGGVWRLRPGEHAFALLPGTELPGDNGIETDPDERRFYVVAFGWHAVVVFDRRDTRAPLARIDAPDFMPDNIHWSAGRLLLAGMRLDEPACGGLRRVVGHVADPMLCHRGWIVGELTDDRIATVAYGGPAPSLNGVSAAALAGGALWLGSFQSDRLAVVAPPAAP